MASKIKASHILVEKQSQALKVLEELKAGKDFEQVAKQRPGVKGHGAGGSEHKFWDLGYMHWAQIPTILHDPLRKLKTGEVSGVISGPAGRFWILKVVARQEDEGGTFDNYSKTVKAAMRRAWMETRRSEVLEALRKDAKIEKRLEDPKPKGKRAAGKSKVIDQVDGAKIVPTKALAIPAPGARPGATPTK